MSTPSDNTTVNTIADSILQCDPTLNQARHALYRLLSIGLLDPRTGTWPMLADAQFQASVWAAAELIRDELSAHTSQLGLGERPIEQLDPHKVFSRLPASDEELNAEYEQTFGLLVSGNCPPYETEYIGGKLAFQRSGQMADIAGFYSAFGLEVSETHPERHDHLSLQLEFMAVLIGLEQAARAEFPKGCEKTDVCLQTQEQFLREHLAWWAPTFSKLLIEQNPDGYYAKLGVFLSAFIPAERALFGIEPLRTEVKPALAESPTGCEGCALPQ